MRNELYPSQLKSAEEILDISSNSSGPIIYRGPSGVGKSRILNCISGELKKNSYSIASGDLVQKNKSEIVMMTPAEYARYIDRHAEIKDVPSVKAKGLTEEESLLFINKLPRLATPKDIIMNYSLGIPLLMEHFAKYSHDEDFAIHYAALYLRGFLYGRLNVRYTIDPENIKQRIKENSAEYLKMPINDDVLEGTGKKVSTLGTVFQKLPAFKSTASVLPPIFVDQKSWEVYKWVEDPTPLYQQTNDRFYDSFSNNYRPQRISIFAPSFPHNTIPELTKEMAIDPKLSWKAITEQEPNRVRAFHIDSVKNGIAVNVPNGEDIIFGEDGWRNEIDLSRLLERLNKGQFDHFFHRLKNNQANPSLLARFDAHSGSEVYTIRGGIMIETLLQQLGVPYITELEPIRKTYKYDPLEGGLSELPHHSLFGW